MTDRPTKSSALSLESRFEWKLNDRLVLATDNHCHWKTLKSEELQKKTFRSVIAPLRFWVPGIGLQWRVITSLMTHLKHLKTVSYFSQSPPTQPSVSLRHNSLGCRVILAFWREKWLHEAMYHSHGWWQTSRMQINTKGSRQQGRRSIQR